MKGIIDVDNNRYQFTQDECQKNKKSLNYNSTKDNKINNEIRK